MAGEYKGVKVTRPAGLLKSGTEAIAFFKDPDGYRGQLVTGH